MRSTQTDLLSGLSQDDADLLTGLGTRIDVPAGETLFDLGQEAERMFVIQRGRVDLTLPLQVRDKQQDILVEGRMAGETVGWSGLIPPHRFTLKAATPVDSEVLAFSRETLLEHFAAHPAVATTVTRNVASVIAHRVSVFQTMWVREMQRLIAVRDT